MFLHGILHRIEGDFDNARYWYSDVAKDAAADDDDDGRPDTLYRRIWGCDGKTFKELGDGIGDIPFCKRSEYGKSGSREWELDQGQRFLNAVQAFKEMKTGARGDDVERGLMAESRREIEGVVRWCVERFGTGRWEDASGAWVKNSEEVQRMSDEQVNGDKGVRKF